MSLGESASSAPHARGTRSSYLKTQMSFSYVQGHTCAERGVCAESNGMGEVCESEIMQGRASPVLCCVSLQEKP